jgi:hypothetical protein
MSQTVLILMSIATGLFFAAWPLRMNQSGLPGAAALFTYACVAIVTAFGALLAVPGAWAALRGRALVIGVQAGVLNVMGVLMFTVMLASASRSEAPRQILIVMITQVAVTGLWAAYQSGAFEPRLLLGFVTALATVWLMR